MAMYTPATLLGPLMAGVTLVSCSAPQSAPQPQPSAQASSQSVVPFNYTLKDAVYVYTCAFNKETDPAEKERLNNGLKILAAFNGKEAEYKASVDSDRVNRHKVLNDLAIKYACY